MTLMNVDFSLRQAVRLFTDRVITAHANPGNMFFRDPQTTDHQRYKFLKISLIAFADKLTLNNWPKLFQQ